MKYTSLLRAFSLTAVFAVTASAGAAEGKALYASKCAACHGPAGEGKDAIAKMFKVTLQHLGSKEIQAKADADMKKAITAGQGKMKPVAGLSDAQIADVIAHVRTLKK
ncbi:MAG: cytochrome c [Candidatus Solibacter usitatus]|nr:cytochrome c [Candidatus Solibacter usitatus]